MSKLVRSFLLLVTVSFFVSYAAADQPADRGGGGDKGGGKVKTELCIMTGDVSSAAPVEVGTAAWQYSPEPITLYLTDKLLAVGPDDEPAWGLTEGDYSGYARVLKKDGRLDFAFTPYDAYGCRPVEWGDEYPFDEVCPYELILMNGLYDRKADTDTFSGATVEKIISYYPPTGGGPGGAYKEDFEVIEGEQVTIDFPPYEQ